MLLLDIVALLLLLLDMPDMADFDEPSFRLKTGGGNPPLILAVTVLTSKSKSAAVSHSREKGFGIVFATLSRLVFTLDGIDNRNLIWHEL